MAHIPLHAARLSGQAESARLPVVSNLLDLFVEFRHLMVNPTGFIGISSMHTTPEYTSNFRPRKSSSVAPAVTVPQIVYEEHEFEKVTITANENGNLEEVVSLLEEKIDISRDWKLYRNGTGPANGYISQGLSKYAFMVRGMWQSDNPCYKNVFFCRVDMPADHMPYFSTSHVPKPLKSQIMQI